MRQFGRKQWFEDFTLLLLTSGYGFRQCSLHLRRSLPPGFIPLSPLLAMTTGHTVSTFVEINEGDENDD